MEESFGVVAGFLEVFGDTSLACGVVCHQQEQKPFGKTVGFEPPCLPRRREPCGKALAEVCSGPQDLSHTPSRCPGRALACRGMCGGQGTAPGGCGMPGAGLTAPCKPEARSRSRIAPMQRGQNSQAPQVPPSMGPRRSASAPQRSDRTLSCYPTCMSWKRYCQSEGLHTSLAGRRGGK